MFFIPPGIDIEPSTILVRWVAYEATFEDGSKSIHFVGCPVGGRSLGRVCSAIQSFDKDQKCGISRSGRHYTLEGPSINDRDADRVWRKWKSMNLVTSEVDVSKNYE